MRVIRYTLILISIVLIIGYFILGLLTNYASVTVPQFLKDQPYLIGIFIGVVIIAIILLTLGQDYLKNWRPTLSRQPMTPRSPSGGNVKQYKYDVFISYSHKNSDWVQGTLLPKLKRHGFSVFIDTYFKGGAFGPAQMEEGVKDSKRVIAVFTEQYFKSDWATLENVMAQILDPAARERKLIPILRESCDIPLRLSGIHYRDLRAEDEKEWERLIEDLI